MRYCYAIRRQPDYPRVTQTWSAEPADFTDALLGRIRDAGFEGLEIGAVTLDTADTAEGPGGAKGFAQRLRDFGVPCVAVRAGGSLIEAKSAGSNRDVLIRSIEHAAALGAPIVAGNLMAAQRHYRLPGDPWGRPSAQDASRDASIVRYERLADTFRAACDRAADDGIKIALELHQQSPVDNSWSASLIVDLVDRPNFGINPDLGNILWNYDVPEESAEDAVRALARKSVYWHCKNLFTVRHPEAERAVAWKVTLSEGEMDYRFLMSAMIEAGFDGYVAIEGGRAGDPFSIDARSLRYLRELEESVR